MKKEEKQLIYNLLKTADAYESGYTREKFAGEPVFEDDREKTVTETESTVVEPKNTVLAVPEPVKRVETTGETSNDTSSAVVSIRQPEADYSTTVTSGMDK